MHAKFEQDGREENESAGDVVAGVVCVVIGVTYTVTVRIDKQLEFISEDAPTPPAEFHERLVGEFERAGPSGLTVIVVLSIPVSVVGDATVRFSTV